MYYKSKKENHDSPEMTNFHPRAFFNTRTCFALNIKALVPWGFLKEDFLSF
jgi:hypothetical protein